MNAKVEKENILFLDIETVPLKSEFKEVSVNEQELFTAKTAYQRGDNITVEAFYQNAGIWAEFGKIICISVGYFVDNNLRITSFAQKKEVDILIAFKSLLEGYFRDAKYVLCGHNAKEFDFPFIARRMIINGYSLPNHLQLFGKKPWEVPHIDTLEMWKFGDYKHYTSLKLLCHVLQLPSPKGDITGSDVARVYYQEKDLIRIVKYCEQDVLALARVFLKLEGLGDIQDQQVNFIV